MGSSTPVQDDQRHLEPDTEGQPIPAPKLKSDTASFVIRAAVSGSDTEILELEQRGFLHRTRVEKTAGACATATLEIFSKGDTPGNDDLVWRLTGWAVAAAFNWKHDDRPEFENGDGFDAPQNKKLYLKITPDAGDDNDFDAKVTVEQGV